MEDDSESTKSSTEIHRIQTSPPPRPRRLHDGVSLWRTATPHAHAHADLHRYESWHSRVDQFDAQQRFQLEREDTHRPSDHEERGERTIVSFSPNDPENADNWNPRKKAWVKSIGMLLVLNSTFGSALPSGAISFISAYFDVTSELQQVLPVSMFLLGYVVGPLFFSPLSEQYGRKPVMLYSFIGYTGFMIGCALAPTWPSLLIFRFLTGINASTPISVIGGFFADLFSDPRERGRTMAYFMVATTVGPLVGPIVSGFASRANWRWTFWIGEFCAVATLPLVFIMPETYGPIILKRRAQKLRKETGNPNIFAPIEIRDTDTRKMAMTTLTRPLRMLFFEALVLFTCLYLSLAYAIFYLFFEAYPLIFEGIYGMKPGVSGLAFLPIGIGAAFACAIFLYYDNYLARAQAANKSWAFIEEYRRLPLACLAGPLWAVGLFWLGWTSSESIHWSIPMLAGIPLGTAFLLLFMALINYLTDAYSIFAASANAAASTCRSIFGALLPLSTQAMYGNLGVNWASSLLGFITLLMSVIPFVFIKYGDQIRKKSQFCQELEKQRREMEEAEDVEKRESGGDVDVEKGDPNNVFRLPLPAGDIVEENEDEIEKSSVRNGQVTEVRSHTVDGEENEKESD